jgi:hypothetical protein
MSDPKLENQADSETVLTVVRSASASSDLQVFSPPLLTSQSNLPLANLIGWYLLSRAPIPYI